MTESVTEERRRQRRKWGVQDHSAGVWLLILMEEVGELSKALLEKDLTQAKEELTQVCAVSLEWLESIHRTKEL